MKSVKKRKTPNLPNGYGSIRWIGAGRARPYAVHPPATTVAENGHYIRPPALCYVSDWYVGLMVLNAWHAGTYKKGDELAYQAPGKADARDLGALAERMVSDFAAWKSAASGTAVKTGPTFGEVCKMMMERKYGKVARRRLSEHTRISDEGAIAKCGAIMDLPIAGITHAQLQAVVDGCGEMHAMAHRTLSIIRQTYKHALTYEIIEVDRSAGLTAPAVDVKHGTPFTASDLAAMWGMMDDPTFEMILIMCYSGYRVSAYHTLDVDLEAGTFTGGVKTAAGKGRIVPIHSAIEPLVRRRLARDGNLLAKRNDAFFHEMQRALAAAGMERHTPHDCRHTFSVLCERHGVRENDRKRMLGHSFGSDITNAVYGHRTVEELRAEIEKIPAPCDME